MGGKSLTLGTQDVHYFMLYDCCGRGGFTPMSDDQLASYTFLHSGQGKVSFGEWGSREGMGLFVLRIRLIRNIITMHIFLDGPLISKSAYALSGAYIANSEIDGPCLMRIRYQSPFN